MSTTDSASVTPGMQQNGNIAPLSLPSFASARDSQDRQPSRAESSASGSRWSAGGRDDQTPDFHMTSSNADARAGRRDHQSANTTVRRNRNRGSGGFLLEPTTHSSRVSRAILSNSQATKGKRKNELDPIAIPKRRTKQPPVRDYEPSHRSSPLSIELKQEQDDEQNTKYNNGGPLDGASDLVDVHNGRGHTPTSQPSLRSSIGNENDAAQIVQMALKLSEGRRRQASLKRYVSGEAQRNRTVSTVSSHPIRTPTKSLSQHVVSPPTASGSPLPLSSLRNGANDQDNDVMIVDDPFSSPGPDTYVSDPEFGIEISRATASRVEKAKVYLELAYEHRRLLSHLPPIANPAPYGKAGQAMMGSKTYNPLQYARNRKLRLREKSTIDTEVEGWHEIEKVRAWVDAVIDSHSETRHDPLECVRLPPLSLKEEDEEDDNRLERIGTSNPAARLNQAKPRRPKSDWVTHPADLLADAFWLEQGLNKTKIQDRDNNPIYPADTAFKFSGWRNRNPLDMPNQLQQVTIPPAEPIVEEKPAPLASAPALPTFRSAHKKEKAQSPVARVAKIKSPLATSHGNSRRWKLTVSDSSSDSDSDSDISSTASNEGNIHRGRERVSEQFNLPEGDPFGPPIASIHEENGTQKTTTSSTATLSDRYSKRSSMDSSRLSNYLRRNSTAKSASRERGRSRGEKRRHRFLPYSKNSKNRKKKKNKAMEEDDDDNAPSSAEKYVLPSIAIDFDTADSRSPSPTKKDNRHRLQSWRDRSRHSDMEKVDTNDFAQPRDGFHSRGTSVDISKTRESSNHTSRGTSPLTRGPSPLTKPQVRASVQEDDIISPTEQRGNTISRQSTRPLSMQLQEPPSKIRGMFKGGRIAELVGNEVSRVGDFIWKREVPPAYRHRRSGSEASFRTTDRSDTEEDAPNGDLYKRQSRDHRRSTSTQSSGGGRRSLENTRTNDKAQLHNPNLPSFISPFQRDREKLEKKQDVLASNGLSDSDDHISRQVLRQKSNSKSPRLSLLTPLKLDTGGPRSAGVMERKDSYGFDSALPRSQSASRALQDALNTRSSKSTSARSSTAGPLNRVQASVTEVPVANSSGRIDIRDLYRIEALLMISAVKARYITSSYDPTSTESLKLPTGGEPRGYGRFNAADLRRIHERDERVQAARQFVAQLSQQNDQINEQLRNFSSKTVSQLHQRIQELEDHIENTITPRVRVAADNAGELSVKLTTTSTLEVKNLQDTISEAFRLRRRGPFRWVRFVWYTAIEWFVVGLLWLIWALVTLVRICLGLSKAVRKTVRWLLWID